MGIHNFLYDTYKTYRIYYANHIYVIRVTSSPKKGKKRGKKYGKHLKMHLEIAFCIISHMIPTTFIEYTFNRKDVLSNTHKPYKIHYFNLKCIIRERAMKVEILKMHLEMTFFAYFLMNTKKNI